jgi:prepilin-type N-terminal cleavage/methylation domain-containing protein
VTHLRIDTDKDQVAVQGSSSTGRGQEGLTLVELLVAMTISVILGTMIVGTWWALQKSYAYSVRSNQARQTARDCMSRMVREIRDAQGQPAGQPFAGYPPIQYASANEITFTTAFNDPGQGEVLLVRYWYDTSDGTIYRQRDTNQDGAFTSADRKDVMARFIVNDETPSASNPTALFTYTWVDSSGNTQISTSVSDTTRVRSVQIRIIADLNPGKSPTYMDLVSTVQPRNQRQI